MLPEQFVNRMKEMLGEESAEFFHSFEEERSQALRVNRLKGDEKKLQSLVDWSLSQVPWTRYGYYYEQKDAPGKHPYHMAGAYYIQEPSAMVPAELLEAQPGERILDLCAAPGGKSTAIAADMKGKGILVCNEINKARAKILSENVERMGIRNAIVCNEPSDKLAEHFPEFFHRIMVDAPCSGEGMFRKNEEAVTEWSPENVTLCANRQDEILHNASLMLAPGGRIVYSTCTFAREENEGSIERFLKNHSEFVLEHMERVWPHKVKGEGHFAAVLRRQNEEQISERIGEIEEIDEIEEAEEIYWKTQKTLKEKSVPECMKFLKDTLTENCLDEMKGGFLLFGDQVYVLPENAPVLDGLHVLRPGLHLGTMKKNRFEPSHSLALALNGEQVKNVYELESLEKAAAYIGGETFEAEGEKGWYLLTIHGYSIGWGKLAGGVMKNHFPKGLRK